MFPEGQNPGRDRLSELPNCILLIILSFLPVKDLVATSVLARRWRPLWCCLPTLDISDESFASFEDFHRAVYYFILNQNTSLPLDSFRLKCGNTIPETPSDIDSLLLAVMRRDLRDIHLEMGPLVMNMMLPRCVLRCCTTLVTLKLQNLSIGDLTNAPCFPSLKTLHLQWITFMDHKHVFMFLSGCPLLEDLLTNRLHFSNAQPHQKELQTLPNLLKADISNMDIPLTLLHNTHFLRVQLNRANFTDVPWFLNLTHLEVMFKFGTLQSHWLWLVNLLQHCPKLHNLVLDKAFSYRDGLDDWVAPEIVLECISSQLKTCLLRDYGHRDSELRLAKYIIQNAKILKTITIQSYFLVDESTKLATIKELCSCPRGSAECKVVYV